MPMLRAHNPSTNLKRSGRSRDRDITITLHTGRTDPKPVGVGRQSGRTAALNRSSSIAASKPVT